MPPIVALAMGILAAAGCTAIGVWQFATRRPPSGLAVCSLALGSALLILAAGTYVVYAVPSLRAAREVGVNLVLSLAAYAGVFLYVVVRYRVEFSSMLFAAALGLVGLWFFGFYTALLVACSFGDCI